MQEEEEQVAVPNKPKLDSLLEYHKSGSDSNGSSPATASDQVEKEIVQYKAEAKIDNTADRPTCMLEAKPSLIPPSFSVCEEIYCITATSVPSERMFSEARTIVDKKKRCSLNPSNVDCLFFTWQPVYVRKLRTIQLFILIRLVMEVETPLYHCGMPVHASFVSTRGFFLLLDMC